MRWRRSGVGEVAGYNPKRLRLKSRQAPLTFMRAWYSALPAELRAAQRYTPPSRIWGLVTLTCETVEPSESVYWLARCAESRATGSSSNVQVMVGGGAPLAAHMREKGSPGATTRSLKDETIRGVPSDRKKRGIQIEHFIIFERHTAEMFISYEQYEKQSILQILNFTNAELNYKSMS